MKGLLNYNLIDLKELLLISNVTNLMARLNDKIMFYLVMALMSGAMLIGFALLATIGVDIALLGLFGCLIPFVLCLYKIALYKRILFNIKASLNFN